MYLLAVTMKIGGKRKRREKREYRYMPQIKWKRFTCAPIPKLPTNAWTTGRSMFTGVLPLYVFTRRNYENRLKEKDKRKRENIYIYMYMSKCRSKFFLSNTTWYCIKILKFFTMFTIIWFNFASQRKIRKMYRKNPQDFSLFKPWYWRVW